MYSSTNQRMPARISPPPDVARREKCMIGAKALVGGMLAVGGLSVASTASAAVLLQDDFESYADTAALDAAWPIADRTTNPSGGPATFLDSGPAGSTNTSKTIHNTTRTSRSRFFPNTAPTAAEPLVMSLDIYDSNAADTGINQYAQIRAFNDASALTQLISLGISSLGPDDTNYQARVAFGSVNWISLNADRSTGWHSFTAEIFPDSVNFYVDGVLDTTVTGITGGVGDSFSQMFAGPTGLSNRAEEGYYDNVLVQSVPEPTALAALGLGGLALLVRRRRA